MRPLHHPIAALLLGLYLAGCYSWHREALSPIEAVSQAEPSTIRVTTRDGTLLVLDHPAVRNDSIVGRTREGPVQLAAYEIGRLEVRRFSIVNTGGLVLGISAGLAAIGVGLFLIACDGSSCIGS